jgi:hypothetical protein
LKHLRLLTAFAVAALASAAQAETDLAAKDLLAAPETALGGAILACAEATIDPAAADTTFKDTGWQSVEDYDGTTAWEQGDLWTMYWTEPGFCMVADEAISTAQMEATLLGLTDTPPTPGTDEDGCTTYDLGPVVATLTSSGNDPTCTSDRGAALRFLPTT